MRGFFQLLLPFFCQILFITPTTQLTIHRSCYSYPNFSPTAALASAKNIGKISKTWLSYYQDNYDNKNADQERLEIVEDGLAAAFGLLSLRQPELDDWHRRIIKDNIETIISMSLSPSFLSPFLFPFLFSFSSFFLGKYTHDNLFVSDVFDKTANSPPDNLEIHCNLDWLNEEHKGKSYKKDTAFHQPDDTDAADLSGLGKHEKWVWLWSDVHQRWIRSVPKKALCRGRLGFARKFQGSLIHVIQLCPKAIEATGQHSELRKLRDEPDGSIFPRRSLDDVAESIAALLFHEMSHTNANSKNIPTLLFDGNYCTIH